MKKIYKIAFFITFSIIMIVIGLGIGVFTLECNTGYLEKTISELQNASKRKTEIIQTLLGMNSIWNKELNVYNEAWNQLRESNITGAERNMDTVDEINIELQEKSDLLVKQLEELKDAGYDNIQSIDYWEK